jgi:hypothetical protein
VTFLSGYVKISHMNNTNSKEAIVIKVVLVVASKFDFFFTLISPKSFDEIYRSFMNEVPVE